MKILVTGGRDFSDRPLLYQVLNKLAAEHDIETVIHGGARGADQLAATWAISHGIEPICCPADWDKYGKAAGPIRNRQMLRDHRPDLVVAFPGNKGTKDMVSIAKKAGIAVIQVEL